jgi:predicted ATPase/DNA-binding SARP family transcriptional activator
LLALLVLNLGRVTPAERLIDELWGKAAPREPANALQVAVFKLRQVLGGDLIETRAPGYLLDVASESVDAHRFERFVAEGRRALAEGRTDAAIGDFDRALAEWRGDALAEFGDVRTPSAAASRLEELRAAVVEDRFAALLAAGHAAELVPELDVAIAAAPLREGLRSQLMLALYRSGRQADALRAFRDARRVLIDEVGVEPGTDLRRLEAAILAQDPSLDAASVARPAPVSPPPTTPTNIRTPLTSFVGRQRDVETVGELLNGNRLVTLVGAGGCGKTRLATELAMAATPGFPGGVWFVPLETLGAGGDVPVATAAALGLSTADTAGQPALATTGIVDRVRGLLTDRTALMVLDNCEHVIDAAARLADDLLSAAPGLHVLATSREALRIPGETVWSVPPLDVDDAVALFTERARAAAPEFELSDHGRMVVGELCRRLDGMPLAVELIAARARVFTVDQLAERLDDRFRLLTGGARTALPRQQTLRAVTDWSYDLLFNDERAVFERLSVFAGGCTLEAAESVCADADIPTAEVGDVIGRLVDKSLVVADGSGRYRLLLTFIHYGHERLAEREGGETVRDRHAAFFRELGVASYGHMRRRGGPSHSWWLASLTTELDNIRAALEWSIACQDGLSAQLLAGHMGWYWWQSGRIVEGYDWLERALGCASPTPAAARAPVVTWAARLGVQLGHTARATELASEAVRLSTEANDHIMLGMAWNVAAQLDLLEGRTDQALVHLDAAEQATAMNDDPWSRGIAALVRSQSASMRSDHEEAHQQAIVAIETFRLLGDVSTLVAVLDQYSRMLVAADREEEARAALSEARDLSEEHGLRGWLATTSTRLGVLVRTTGDLARAAALHRAAIDLARELALPTVEIDGLDGLGVVQRRRGDFEDARHCHTAARALADRVGHTLSFDGSGDLADAAAFSTVQLGYVAEQVGDLDEAWRCHDEALSLARRRGNDHAVALAVEGLAGVAAADGDGELAATLLGQARRLRLAVGTPMHGDDDVDRERAEMCARGQLGDDGYQRAHDAGLAMSVDAALAGSPRRSVTT